MRYGLTDQLCALAEQGDLDSLRSKLDGTVEPLGRRHLAMLAAKNGHLDMLRFLVESGTEIEMGMVQAALKSDKDHNSDVLIKYLIGTGMDVNMHLDRMGSALVYAMALGQPDEYIEYILDNGANPDEWDLVDEWTSMELVVTHNPKLIPKFIAHGAQVRGTRALGKAASAGVTEAVRMLLPYFDTELSKPIEDLSYYGRDDKAASGTALDMAVQNGHLETAQVLLDAGADASVRNSQGDTSLDTAKHRRFQEIVKLLEAFERDKPLCRINNA